MKRETFINICCKILEKDMPLGTFSLELCKYMAHKPHNKTPAGNFLCNWDDKLQFCFLIYLTTKGGLLEEPTYVVHLSVMSEMVELDHFTGFNPEEINLVLELYKRKEQQIEEALKEFLES